MHTDQLSTDTRNLDCSYALGVTAKEHPTKEINKIVSPGNQTYQGHLKTTVTHSSIDSVIGCNQKPARSSNR